MKIGLMVLACFKIRCKTNVQFIAKIKTKEEIQYTGDCAHVTFRLYISNFHGTDFELQNSTFLHMKSFFCVGIYYLL